jgi:tetratricopeptide (TPR) repeat protein
MKKVSLILFVAFSFLQLNAITTNNTVELDSAAKLYSTGKFEQAKELYQKLLLEFPNNSTLHYNVGNCHFKLQQIAYAIYHYEKSLKTNPNNEDAIHNLQLANLQTIDKLQTTTNFIFINYIKSILLLFSYTNWAIIGICALFFSIMFFLLFLLSNSLNIRKIGFYSFLFLVIFGLLFQFIAYYQYSFLHTNKYAITKNAKNTFWSAPTKNAKKMFVLHEGAKVAIEKNDSIWTYVVLPNKTKGWIKNDALLEI